MPSGDALRCASSLMVFSLFLQYDELMSPEGECIGLVMQGLALPGLGRLRNGQTQLRASTFYKMVHFVSMPSSLTLILMRNVGLI